MEPSVDRLITTVARVPSAFAATIRVRTSGNMTGWQVANLQQYRAARAFPEAGKVRLTLWRGTQLLDATIPNRDLMPEFTVDNYPPKGWVE